MRFASDCLKMLKYKKKKESKKSLFISCLRRYRWHRCPITRELAKKGQELNILNSTKHRKLHMQIYVGDTSPVQNGKNAGAGRAIEAWVCTAAQNLNRFFVS